MKPNYKELRALLALIIIFICAIILILLFGSVNNSVFVFIMVYFVLVLLLQPLIEKNIPVISRIIKFLSIPVAVILVLLMLLRPAVIFFFKTVFYFTFSTLIPFLLVKFNEKFNLLAISFESEVFILLTFSSIIAVWFQKYIFQIISHIPILTISRQKNNQVNEKTNELLYYSFSKPNVRFIIYLVFFTFLIVYSFNSFENKNVFSSEKIDKSILQSFLSFLAFDRILQNSKNWNFKPSDFLKSFIQTFRKPDY